MKTIQFISKIIAISFLCVNILSGHTNLSANSHGFFYGSHTSDNEKPKLHVNNNKWPECAIELDPSLSQSDFRKFGQEASSFLYFKSVCSPKTLKKWKFELSLTRVTTGKICDDKTHWNNTFTHPDSAHWLVPQSKRLTFPHLNFRIGISSRIDLGGYFIYLPSKTNYGFAGVDSRYRIINDTAHKIYLTGRLALTTLLGTKDMNFHMVSHELSFGKSFGLFTPYAGISASLGYMEEQTDKVNLNKEYLPLVSGVTGIEFNYKFISVGVEATLSKLNMYTLKLGARF